MNKKGFTLAETLAVITIIALLGLITVISINSSIDKNRRKAFKETVNGIVDAVKLYRANNDFTDLVADYDVVNNEDIEYLQKDKIVSGHIRIDNGTYHVEYITNGEYCAFGTSDNITVGKNCNEVDGTKPLLTGSQNKKQVTITMIDNESGIDSYCLVKGNDECTWIKTNNSTETLELISSGTWHITCKDKKGNISDELVYETLQTDYCSIEPGYFIKFTTVGINTWTVPEGCDGIYELEVRGAAGGNYGGAGGVSKGNAHLEGNLTLYIGVGGAGGNTDGGWNGGGSGNSEGGSDGLIASGGGGATHIAKVTGTLASIGYASFVTQGNGYIVAGGGGGGAYLQNTGNWHPSCCGTSNGGSGGGTKGGASARYNTSIGNDTSGGTQTSGYKFGKGSSGAVAGAGGGGGFYGGGGGYYAGGGGGSGWIGGVENGTTTSGGNSGKGKAQITLISLD